MRSFMPRILAVACLLFATGAFAAGNYTQNFASTPSGWSVANDAWTATGDYRNSNGVIPPALAWYTGSSWTTNYTYKIRAYSEWPDTGNELGVVFGLTDSTHYFQVVLSMDGVVDLSSVSGNPSSPTLITSKSVSPATIGLASDSWFDLEVFVNGNTVTVSVNGRVVIARAAITPVNGKIGVIARANMARFDDVEITDNLSTQLFRGNFTEMDGTAVDVSAPNINCSTGSSGKNCYSEIKNSVVNGVQQTDTSGYTWPIKLWGDGDSGDPDGYGGLLQYLSHSSTGEVTDYAGAAIETTTGHTGNPTHALHQWLSQGADLGNPQVPYVIRPKNTFSQQHDLYLRFWLKYPSALTGYWQMPFQFKTPGADVTDGSDPSKMRVSLFATNSTSFSYGPACGSGQWHWLVQADPGIANSTNVKWQACNATAAVPIGSWFKVEIFFHRATSATGSGRIWVAIDSNVIIDYTVDAAHGGMYAQGAAIERLMLPQMYGGDAWPREQFVDDLEIWNGFPSNASTPH